MTDRDQAVTRASRPAVRTVEVWKTFPAEPEPVHAVRGVSMTVGHGEFTAIAGPSGCGKTTLLNLLGGLTRPTSGEVWVAGQEVGQLSERALARLRLNSIGFVFQAYNLLPVLTALENAEFTLLLRGRTRRSGGDEWPSCSKGWGWRGWRIACRGGSRAVSSSGSRWFEP